MLLEIESKVFSNISKLDKHPISKVFVDPGYTLTGGGAWLDYGDPGNLLTESCPIMGEDGTWSGWQAQGKDVWVSSKASITAFAIGVRITKDGQPVRIAQKVITARDEKAELSDSPRHDGWIGVGGGVKCIQNIFENVLLSETAPFRGLPEGVCDHRVTAWYGNKQYCFSPTSDRGPTGGGETEVFLIAIRVPGIPLATRIRCAVSDLEAHPEVQVDAEGGVVVSGGAFDKQSQLGFAANGDPKTVNMLTGTHPVCDSGGTTRITGWKASGKEHHYPSPSVVSAYVVTLFAEA